MTSTATEERIRVLEGFLLDEDNTVAEAPTFAIQVDNNYDFHYKDSTAYETRWVEETKQLTEIVRKLLLAMDAPLFMWEEAVGALRASSPSFAHTRLLSPKKFWNQNKFVHPPFGFFVCVNMAFIGPTAI
jgi:hypothetical protein